MEKNKKEARKFSLIAIINGRLLTEESVSKQLKLLALIVVLIIIFISNNYSCTKKMAEIEQLKTQLREVKDESLILSTKLTSVCSPSQVKELLERRNINLSVSTSPAFEIQK